MCQATWNICKIVVHLFKTLSIIMPRDEIDASLITNDSCYTFSYSILFWYHDSLLFYFYFKHYTVPFKSIRQSHITRPSKTLKCHGGHSNFCKVLNSFSDHVPNIEIFRCLRRKTAENLRHVMASLGGCRNQNFGRPVTGRTPCRVDLNGTV